MVKAVGTRAPSGLLRVLAMVSWPRSLVMELATVRVKVPVVLLMTTEAGVMVGVAQVKPGMGARAASLTVQVLPVGMPLTVAEPPGATSREPVRGVPLVSRPQS